MSRLVPALLISNLILGSLLIVGWRNKPGIVEASEFRLVDEAGKTRAMLRVVGDSSQLALWNHKGEQRVFISESNIGDFVIVGKPFDKKGGAMLASTTDKSYVSTSFGESMSMVDATKGDSSLLLGNGKSGVVAACFPPHVQTEDDGKVTWSSR